MGVCCAQKPRDAKEKRLEKDTEEIKTVLEQQDGTQEERATKRVEEETKEEETKEEAQFKAQAQSIESHVEKTNVELTAKFT